jgi:hypothetical protein
MLATSKQFRWVSSRGQNHAHASIKKKSTFVLCVCVSINQTKTRDAHNVSIFVVWRFPNPGLNMALNSTNGRGASATEFLLFHDWRVANVVGENDDCARQSIKKGKISIACMPPKVKSADGVLHQGFISENKNCFYVLIAKI